MRALQRVGLIVAAMLAMFTAAAVGVGISATPASASPSVVNIGVGSPNYQGVYCIQQALNYVAGTSLAVDGQFGTATRNAVINFQRFFGLTADGIVGKKTGGLLGYLVDRKAGWGLWAGGGCYNYVPSET